MLHPRHTGLALLSATLGRQPIDNSSAASGGEVPLVTLACLSLVASCAVENSCPRLEAGTCHLATRADTPRLNLESADNGAGMAGTSTSFMGLTRVLAPRRFGGGSVRAR
eukprot:CAMPEP_0202049684 /NCGR_PEP_ID=MMETSP0963-20130614/3544_1 /ASSEMBLY_ACC=CAM_ASM_000494 /TAXON_ID=4773 /ORGANISM="Schizochytrium aggregatum, Strain ATCC28209" /LENGTH=109 /DNA_ID=CAMNT_0048614717 /DNA_START=354 /DNA_END=680 /DNA_ORIENTATION=-